VQGLVDLQQSVASLRQMRFAGELGMALAGLALAQHLLGQEELAWASLEEALQIALKPTADSQYSIWVLRWPCCWLILATGSWQWKHILR